MLFHQLVFGCVLAIVPAVGAIAVYYSFNRPSSNDDKQAHHAARG